jgi:predicted dehydrogenase
MGLSRRKFLKRSSLALAGAAAAVEFPFISTARADDGAEIKIGLIGCGGRGTGAVCDALGAAVQSIYPSTGYHTENVEKNAKIEKKNIKVVALADLFADRLEQCKVQLGKLGVDVPQGQCFTGFDAYEHLLAMPEVNYVILATPPHFRPMHFKAAVEAGKHVFMEKPVAVDVPGVKMVMQAGELARQKNLCIVAGTQRRRSTVYQETMRKIHDGAIGDIVYARCYFNVGEIWVIDRQPGWSDMEWQLRNWEYFTWLSGDHFVEQPLHSLDVMNWALGSHPVSAFSGLGGRQVRTDKRYGYIYDHFAVEYEYPNGVRMFSQARQINGCVNYVNEFVVGAEGTANCDKGIIETKKGEKWRCRLKNNPYQQEHVDLIAGILSGTPLNEAQQVAETTLTAIIGREAVYSGQSVEWDAALNSTKKLGPDKYEFGPYPTPDVPMPGQYKFL